MREILFKGKTIRGQEVTGYYVYSTVADDGTLLSEPAHLILYNVSGRGLYSVKVEPKSVKQFTGKRDKYGNMIFEGDMIEWLGHSVSNFVQWSKKYLTFGVMFDGKAFLLSKLPSCEIEVQKRYLYS